MNDFFNLAYPLLTRGDKITTPRDYYSILTSDPQYLTKNGISFCKKGRKFRRKAVSLLTSAILGAPKCKYCYLLRGIVKWTMEPGISEAAISDCTKAIELDDTFAAALFYRGRMKLGGDYGTEPDFEGALADFDLCLELDPEYALAYLARANLKRDLRNRLGALSDLDKFMEIGLPPAFEFPSWTLVTRGKLKISLSLYEEAIDDFNRVLEQHQGSTARSYTFKYKAFLLRKSRHYRELVQECDDLLGEGVNFAVAVLEERARANRLLLNYREAANDYGQQILLEPDNQEAYRARSFVRKKLGDLDGSKNDRQLYKKIGMPPF